MFNIGHKRHLVNWTVRGSWKSYIVQVFPCAILLFLLIFFFCINNCVKKYIQNLIWSMFRQYVWCVFRQCFSNNTNEMIYHIVHINVFCNFSHQKSLFDLALLFSNKLFSNCKKLDLKINYCIKIKQSDKEFQHLNTMINNFRNFVNIMVLNMPIM